MEKYDVLDTSPREEFLYEQGNFRASWPNRDVGAETASRGSL